MRYMVNREPRATATLMAASAKASAALRLLKGLPNAEQALGDHGLHRIGTETTYSWSREAQFVTAPASSTHIEGKATSTSWLIVSGARASLTNTVGGSERPCRRDSWTRDQIRLGDVDSALFWHRGGREGLMAEGQSEGNNLVN